MNYFKRLEFRINLKNAIEEIIQKTSRHFDVCLSTISATECDIAAPNFRAAKKSYKVKTGKNSKDQHQYSTACLQFIYLVHH